MADASSLSLAALCLRSRLKKATNIAENRIVIGHPQAAAEQRESEQDEDLLNLFFYRVELDGYPTDGASDEPCYLRAHCLITALGGKSSDSSRSSGEVELQLMSAVIADLHAHPTITISDLSTQPLAKLQIVPASFTLDNLNHLWATQSNVPYRLSVAYELALMPLPPAQRKEEKPRVGSIAVVVRPDLIPPILPKEGFPLVGTRPQAPYIQVDVRRPDWTPHLCFLDEEGNAVYTLSVKADGNSKVHVIALGEPGEELKLTWNIWSTSNRIWELSSNEVTYKVLSSILDPHSSKGDLQGVAQEIQVPISDSGQALLLASRSWQAHEQAPAMTLTSNPLLVTLECEQ